MLARENDRLLAIAKCGLDAVPYNKEWVDTNWLQCTMRSWLNGFFMAKAFSDEEQQNLMEVTLTYADRHADMGNVPGSPDTMDKVFLLSLDEAEHYFNSEDERCCRPTAYAVGRGAWISENGAYAGNCWWWLRSASDKSSRAAGALGFCEFYNSRVHPGFGAVRPAVFLNL